MSVNRASSGRSRLLAAMVVATSVCLLLALTASLTHAHGHQFDDPIDCAVCLLVHSPTTAAQAATLLPADAGCAALPNAPGAGRIPHVAPRQTAPRAPPFSLEA